MHVHCSTFQTVFLLVVGHNGPIYSIAAGLYNFSWHGMQPRHDAPRSAAEAVNHILECITMETDVLSWVRSYKFFAIRYVDLNRGE